MYHERQFNALTLVNKPTPSSDEDDGMASPIGKLVLYKLCEEGLASLIL
jgi:hypothetical protein